MTHRIGERLAAWGHEVTLLTASFPGASSEEELDGVQVIRRGGQLSVHWEAAKWYRQQGQGAFDVVIDEINTIPFFAPLYAGVPVVAYINQLAREVWWHEAPRMLAWCGYIVEPWYLKAYRRTPVVTISASTADDLVALGHTAPRHIIPMAIDLEPLACLDEPKKEARPTLVHLGRIAPSKRIDHAIEALGILQAQGTPEAQLWIIGRGDVRENARLRDLAYARGLEESVRFWGGIPDEEKTRLLQRAHILVACSVREGWGLAVTEANAMGTPAVVYDVPGLRDSTRHGETGLVCQENAPASLAEGIATLLQDPAAYGRLQQGAWEWSKTFNWDATARSFAEALQLQ